MFNNIIFQKKIDKNYYLLFFTYVWLTTKTTHIVDNSGSKTKKFIIYYLDNESDKISNAINFF